MPMQVNPAAEPLYIVKPFSGGGMAGALLDPPPDRGARAPAARDGASRLKTYVTGALAELRQHEGG